MPAPDAGHEARCPEDQAPTISLLGQPCLQVPGRAPVVLERRDAALLAALVLQGPLARERAAALLWPLAERRAAQNSLRQRLFRLKLAAGQPLVAQGSVLRLASGWRHDLDAFPQRVAAGLAVPDELLATLGYADTGELAEWVDRLRLLWQSQRRAALIRAADEYEQAQRWDGALACTGSLLRVEPAEEAAHYRMMRVHYLAGDRAAALAAWARCQQQLRDAGLAGPDARTRQLAELIHSGGTPPGAVDLAVTDLRQLALQHPPRLVGRDVSWRLLQGALDRGLPVVLRGDAGMGKTRLAEDLVRDRGPLCAVKARAGDAAEPCGLLARLLRAVLPRLPALAAGLRADLACIGAPAAPAVPTPRLRRALAAVLAAWRGLGAGPATGTLLIDDAQWADAASLELVLGAWSQAGPGARPALLLVLRSGETPAAVSAWLSGQPDGGGPSSGLEPVPVPVHEHTLDPLDADGMAELLRSLPGIEPGSNASLAADDPTTAARLLHASGGNPHFALEILRAQGVPGAGLKAGGVELRTLAQLLQRRLSALPAPALKLLRLSAFAGSHFSAELALHVLGGNALELAQTWRQLQDARLLQDNGAVFDLVQDAVFEELPRALHGVLHAQVAQALAAQGASDAAVAPHWVAAGRWADAARAQERAAAQACLASRHAEALGLLDSAARHYREAGSAAEGWNAAWQAVRSAMVVQDHTAVEQRLDTLAATAPDASLHLDVLLLRCRLLLNAGDGASALPWCQQAVKDAAAVGSPAQRLRAAAWAGLALALNGQPHEAARQLERDAQAAGLLDEQAGHQPGNQPGNQPGKGHSVDDERARLDIDGALGFSLHVAGRPADALVALRRALQRAQALGDGAEALEQACNLMTCHGSLAQRAAAIEAGEQAFVLWRQLGEPEGVTALALHVQLAVHHTGAGHFGHAIELLQRALGPLRSSGAQGWRVIAEHRLATVWLRLGQPARARQVLGPLPAGATVGNRVARLLIDTRLAHLAGQPVLPALREARAGWAAAAEPMDSHSLALMLAAHAPPGEAVALCDELIAAGAGDAPLLAHAGARRAAALCALGRLPEAAAQARVCWAEGSHGSVLDMDHPQWCELLWRALRTAGDERTAHAVLASGLEWVARTRAQVPGVFIESFEQRHAPVRALLAAAQGSQAGQPVQPPA